MADGVKKINEYIMKDGRVICITKDLSANKFEGGTLYIHPNQGLLKYNNVDNSGSKTWKKFLPSNIFDEKTIVRALLQDSIINESKIEDSAVSERKIKNDAVTSVKIKNGSVIRDKIADENVTREKIARLAINTEKLADSSVTTPKINNLAITTDKLGLGAVTNNTIANETIRNEKLYNKTITNEKIANATIIEALLAANCVTESKVKEASIKDRHIASNQIKEIHIVDRSVTRTKIQKKSVFDEHLNINNINGDKLLDLSVGETKLKDASITNRKISNGSVDYEKLESHLRTLIDESIRVEGVNNTATVKGNLKVEGNIDAIGNITGAKVFNPVFADIAEAYIPVTPMEAGDAVCLCNCGGLRIEKLNNLNTARFIGFVSNNYASCFGATDKEIESGEKVAVALTGRIPVKVDDANIFNIGDFIGISNCKVIVIKNTERNKFKRYEQAVGRVLDRIDNHTILCQIF